jgi:hypothetical protein
LDVLPFLLSARKKQALADGPTSLVCVDNRFGFYLRTKQINGEYSYFVFGIRFLGVVEHISTGWLNPNL